MGKAHTWRAQIIQFGTQCRQSSPRWVADQIGGYECGSADIRVTVSDEPAFTNAFLARVAGCSTMITVPALGADRDAPLLREECGRRTSWFSHSDTTAAGKSYRCQSTSSYQVTCTACSPATASIIASVSALAGRPG
jgi:hypothetical protein